MGENSWEKYLLDDRPLREASTSLRSVGASGALNPKP